MRLTYMKPTRQIVATHDWVWNRLYNPGTWKGKLRDFLFLKFKEWGFLKQLYSEQTQMKQIEVEFSVSGLIELIHVQMHQLMDEGRRPAEVILGYEEWNRIARDPDIRSCMNFHCDFTGLMQGYPPLFGMKVRVVPYINGVVVLPEDK